MVKQLVSWTLCMLCIIAYGLPREALADRYGPNDNSAVELNSIQTLIFRKGAMTTARRTTAVPQLTCVGGGACGSGYEPTVVQCTNIGTDYATGDPSWKCTAELENGLRLGTTDVICEGFRDRDDPWILRGSCGLEYTLLGSPVRHQSGSYYSTGDSYQTYKSYSSYPSYTSSSSRGSWMNWLVGFFLLWVFLRYIGSTGNRAARYAQTGHASTGGYGGGGGGFFGGGGGGGGGGRWGTPWGGFGGGLGGNNADCHNAGVGQGGNGGFWQGLGAGAGLGYLFGRYNNNYNNNWGWGGYRNAGGWGTGWGNAAYGHRPQAYAAAPTVNVGPATQTATGYGTTRRRG